MITREGWRQLLLRRVVGFGWVSLVGLGIDLLLFTLGHDLLHHPTEPVNAVSAGVATTFVFCASARRIFGDQGRLWPKYLAWIAWQAALIAGASLFIGTLAAAGWPGTPVKIATIPVTFALNFAVMQLLTRRQRI